MMRGFVHRLLRCALLAAAIGACTPPAPSPACRDCNLVLITVDTLRPDHTSLYGYARETTPNLARFFAGKEIFARAAAPAPCTDPSVWQLLGGAVFADGPSLAEVLRAHGLRSAAVVSQHLFHERGLERLQRGFDHFDIQPRSAVDRHGLSTRAATDVTERALAWMSGAPARFFLWLHYFDPHDPYEPPVEFRRWSVTGSRYLDGDRRGHLRDLAGDRWQTSGHVLTAADTEHFTALYDGEIAFADTEIARVLAALPQNTIVVFTSDHGELLGENGKWDHCLDVDEFETRVPLAMSVPGSGRSKAQTRAAVSTLDVYPTVLRLLGIALPSHLDGTDLFAPGERHSLSFWRRHLAIRDTRFTLYAARENGRLVPLVLFDVGQEPAERKDVGAADPAVVDRLLSAAGRHDWRTATARSDHTAEQLRALGYIQ